MGEDFNNLRQSLGLRMLKSMDSEIDRILFKSNFVTLYIMKDSGWQKANIEGPFFLVSRTGSNKFGFIILNKKYENHMSQLLLRGLKVIREDNFIFYRNSDSDNLYGLWHFDLSESARCYEAILKCVKQTDNISDIKRELNLDQLRNIHRLSPSDYKNAGKEILNLTRMNLNLNTPNLQNDSMVNLKKFNIENSLQKYNLSKETITSAVIEALNTSNFFPSLFEILDRHN